jgi:hypothetical protein
MSSSDLPKLWTTASKIANFILSKSFFSIKNQRNSFWLFSLKNIRLVEQLLQMIFFKVLRFLKICTFVGSIHNFGRSEDDMILKKCLFPIDERVFWCPTWSKNLEPYLLKSERRCLGTKNADPHQYHAPFTDTKDPFQQNVNTFVKPSRCFFYEENKHKGRAKGGSLLGIEPITTYAQSKFLLIFIPIWKTIINSFYHISVIWYPWQPSF